jgi:hypothetical protein
VTTADTDITFTEADISTIVSAYIFAGNSFVGDYLGGITSNPTPIGLPALPAQSLTASDVGSVPSSYTAVGGGDTVDLGTVLYNVAPNAALGDFTVSFITTLFPDPPGGYAWNNLSDENGDAVNVDSFESADIDIVPEPSPLVLLPAGLACLWAFRRARRS